MRHPFPLRAATYIGRSYLSSFALSFLFFFAIFFVNQILLLAEDILSKSAPLDQTLLLLIYSLPSIVAIAFPFAALAGALMTSAGMNADREILAFSAAGVSPRAIYMPFVIIGALASILSFAANDYFLPRSSRDFRALYGKMVARSASIELKPYSVKRYSQAVVVTGEKVGDKAGDVLIFESEGGKNRNLISAVAATLALDPRGDSALIEMEKVVEQGVGSVSEDGFSITKAGSLTYRFAIREPVAGFSSGANPSEMSSLTLGLTIGKKRAALAIREADLDAQRSLARANLIALYGNLVAEPETVQPSAGDTGTAKGRVTQSIQAAQAAKAVQAAADIKEKRLPKAVADLKQATVAALIDRSLQVYELEYYKKFAIPAAGLFFSLLAFPLGLGTKRAGRTAGFGAALLLSTLYWGALFVGQTAGLRSLMSPWMAMWLPDILVLAATAAAWLFRIYGSRRSV